MNKLVKIGLAWGCCIVVYIILAIVYPVIVSLTSQSSSAIVAVSPNAATDYPGLLSGIGAWNLIVWVVPAGVTIVATVVWMREQKD